MPTASFKIRVGDKHEVEVLRALLGELRSTRARPGCLRCYVEQDVECPGGIRFHSSWDAAQHLRAFLASKELTSLLQLLELSLDTPEILICWGEEESGLRSLEAIRGTTESGSQAPQSAGCGCRGGSDV
jgi:quinol monooxygenase YgiN